jgi:hypothetical protein
MTVWKPETVSHEPSTEMRRWTVMEASYENGQPTNHVVGYCYEGRVSSNIVDWNEKDHIATTRSGRRYLLHPDNVGSNPDAQYVWNIWKSYNKVTSEKDVTGNYLKQEETA